ncbi:replication/maintenance protein RepL [Enterococcus faecalis]|uniref:replication/maintenance protein RepL n=1 Tax=Enterococcus faecalis TaxID=1351 RepID=UPI00135F458F|nr:replication/maintenance protein RepL [Enterococcus faecalis]ECR3422515.1 helix-turn-helix domain-containing protein [Campylobacter jejuni]MBE9452398.1 replication/maintenance protein RepL [Enterococcus faecalis]
MSNKRYGATYKGKEKYINKNTGEVLEVDKLYRKQIQGNFVKTYIKGLVMMLDVVGKSKLKVVNFLLDNLRLSDNKLIATIREIAESTKTSPTTVTDTLKTLEKGNIIKRRTGVIMLNPEILLHLDDNKKRHLLIEFEEFNRENEEQHAKKEYKSFR